MCLHIRLLRICQSEVPCEYNLVTITIRLVCTRCGATYGSGGSGGIGGGDIGPTITPTTRPGSMYDGDEGGNETLPPVVDEEVPDETIPPETDETASEEPVQPEADAAVDVQAASQIIASENTTAYSYIYASGKLLQEKVTTNGTTETHNFFYDNTGKPYAMQVNGTTYYYVTNLQGDVMGLVDTSGNSVASYTYDPYGKVLTATGTLAEKNPLRYRGYYYDSESGLYYLQSRYYDPATRRFVNADSYSSTGQGLLGCNMFAYCNNSPILFCDSNGQLGLFAIGAIAAAVISGISNAVATAVDGGTVTECLVAGAIGAATGVVGYLIGSINPAVLGYAVAGRAVSSAICNIGTTLYRKGRLTSDDIAHTMVDVVVDASFSTIGYYYTDSLGSVPKTIVCGMLDGSMDTFEEVIFTPTSAGTTSQYYGGTASMRSTGGRRGYEMSLFN